MSVVPSSVVDDGRSEMIEIAGVSRSFGDRKVLDDVSFTVADGRVTAIDLIGDRERLDQLDIELLPREVE